jgi:hypothetical protein
MGMNTLLTVFPNGVGTNAAGSLLANLGVANPVQYHTFFDDFDGYVVQDGSTSPIVQWTETLNSGTVAMSAVNNGALVLTCANTDEAITQVQRTIATYLPTAGKQMWFQARVKVSAALLTDAFIGMSIIDTTLIASSALGTLKCMGFFKAATSNSLDFYVRKDGTTGSTSATSVATITSDTYFTVGFYYDGVDTVQYMVNGTVLGSVSGTSTYLPDAVLSPSLAAGQEGTAGANALTVDYVFVAQER